MLRSRNYAPCAALSPFVRNHFVFRAPLPQDMVLTDPLLSETAMLRVLIQGDWTAEFTPGHWHSGGPAVLFGNNARCFNVRVRGPFVVAGTAIRPSGWAALCDQHAHNFANAMFPARVAWGEDADTLYGDIVAAADDDDAIIAVLELFWKKQLEKLGNAQCDEAMATFEQIANTDSTMRIADVAQTLGLSTRALERRSCASFGLTPKAVMRRSRFLDMATALRGISNPDEEELAALRFSDQSHLNREFRYFVNMTPGMFEKTPTPLLNAVLRLRWDRSG